MTKTSKREAAKRAAQRALQEVSIVIQADAAIQKAKERHLQCWRCQEAIISGCYNLDDEGPSHKPSCP